MNEHTPGPWKVVNGNIVADNDYRVARTYALALHGASADACLIAAAPDLLEAAEEGERAAQILANMGHAGGHLAAERLRAAIAKATEREVNA